MTEITRLEWKKVSILVSIVIILGHSQVGYSQSTPKTTQLTVVTTLLGVSDKTGLTGITIQLGNKTKAQVLNATDLDYKDQYHDGIVESWSSFANTTVVPGTQIKVCAIVLASLQIACHVGYKTPSERAESATIMLNNSNKIDNSTS